MTETDLSIFIIESGSETRFVSDGEGEFLIWVDHFNIEDFIKLIGVYHLEEVGLNVTLMEDCVCVEMNWICKQESIDIDILQELLNN